MDNYIFDLTFEYTLGKHEPVYSRVNRAINQEELHKSIDLILACSRLIPDIHIKSIKID